VQRSIIEKTPYRQLAGSACFEPAVALRKVRFCLFALLILLASHVVSCTTLAGFVRPQGIEHRFAKESFRSGDGIVFPYRLSSPVRIEDGQQYPIVMLFHGAGERGSNNEDRVLKHFLALVQRPDFRLDEVFVLALQCPEDMRWVEVDWNLPSHRQPKQPSKPMAAVYELLHSLEASLPIDTKRRYGIGLSMGGFAVWDVLSRWPDLLAAGVAVCGGGDELAVLNIHAPVWVFHGSNDGLINVERSRAMVRALERLKKPWRYTEYAGEGHGSWLPAFQEKELLTWMFSNQRP